MTAWRSFLLWLASLAADPVTIDTEGPRSAAAVAAAYAAMRPEDPAPPAPPRPAECPCGGKCQGGRYQPDGNIWQPCAEGCRSCKPKASTPPACRCGGPCGPKCSCGCRSVLAPGRSAPPECPDGTCPAPAAGRGG